MTLVEYRRKRDFSKTAEPRGRKQAARGVLRFVIQKHAASHLHYDFRLELDGVLKSWAVPKGPDVDPSQKRLAMQVEDHPLEYGDFEGIIPPGEYGGGTVMLWDRGTWEPLGDAKKDYAAGRLKFVLHGEKLQGGWMLVRRGGHLAEPGERHWFLFKERDKFAQPGKSITDALPRSVTTKRTLEQIAAQSDRVWGPGGEVAVKKVAAKKVTVKKRRVAATVTRKALPAGGKRTKAEEKVATPAKLAKKPAKAVGTKVARSGGKTTKAVARTPKKRADASTAKKVAGKRRAKTDDEPSGQRGRPEARRVTRRSPRTGAPRAATVARVLPRRGRAISAAASRLIASAPRTSFPASPEVQLATLAKQAPTGDEWLHEIKFDGYRMLCRVREGRARFVSRNGNDWTSKFPELAQAAAAFGADAILDGEVVALRPDGTSSFQLLQNVFSTGYTSELVYYVFDLLHLDGHDLRGLPLDDRKKILQSLLATNPQNTIRLSEHLEGAGDAVVAQACRMHLEGIVSKRRDQPYRPGRGYDWLKVKCSHREEFVIGGFTSPTGGRTHFGALLLGYHNAAGELVYAGRVGTGFNFRLLESIHGKVTGLARQSSPFVDLAGSTGQARGVKWVTPKLVAEIEFSEWTDEGLLRHPSFQGLREDKPASEVVRDRPLSLNEVRAVQKTDSSKARNGAAKRRAAPAKNELAKTKAASNKRADTGAATTKIATTKRTKARAKNAETAGGKTKADETTATKAKRNDTAEIEVAGVRLTHPNKVLYPDQGITKFDLAEYYQQVADWMLPHVAHRPLAIVRCPGGNGSPCFFQKHPGEGASQYLRQVNIAPSGAAEYHLAVDDLAGLVALVQMGVLEVHVWGSTERRLETPDRLIFDLDPDSSVGWPDVVAAAREVRQVLEELGLRSFVKTTGGKGLHVVVPIQPRTEWTDAKSFCRSVAELLVQLAPERYIATMSKAARKGKIFIDYLRNGRGATSVAPYSTRARKGATVSTPIGWDELGPKIGPDHFTIENVPSRLRKLKADPWAELSKTKQSITAAMVKRLATFTK